jgi:hypothetical protein
VSLDDARAVSIRRSACAAGSRRYSMVIRVVPDDYLLKSVSYTISGIRIFRFPPKIGHIGTTQTYKILIFK